jgi:hypothetical protein
MDRREDPEIQKALPLFVPFIGVGSRVLWHDTFILPMALL